MFDPAILLQSKNLSIRKRDGSLAALDIEQIRLRLDSFISSHKLNVSILPICLNQLLGRLVKYDTTILATTYIDEQTVDICLELSDYIADASTLARLLHVDNMHKKRLLIEPISVAGYMAGMDRGNHNPYTNVISSWLSSRTRDILPQIAHLVRYDLDYDISQEGLEIFEKSYLNSIFDPSSYKPVLFELPAEAFTRMAIELMPPGDICDEFSIAYHYLAHRYCSMSTPVVARAGLLSGGLAACFLLRPEDSTKDIYDLNTIAALHAAGGGGIGTVSHPIREKGGYISSTGAQSKGPLAYLAGIEINAKNTSQPTRPASTAVYSNLHHSDIEEHIQMRVETGAGTKCMTLFPGLLFDHLFLRRLALPNGTWMLMPPPMSKSLTPLHGDAFDVEYRRLEALYANHPRTRVVKALDLWNLIAATKIVSGMPYAVSRTNATRFSPQKHLIALFGEGEIQFNLCTEITLYVRRGEVAVCILGAVVIPFCVHYSAALDRSNPSNAHYGQIDRTPGTPLFDFTPKRPYVIPTLYRTSRLADGHDPSGPPPGVLAPTLNGLHGGYLDLFELGLCAYQLCVMLNQVFARNQYPTDHSRLSSLRDRPIAIGMQGLFDAFTLLGFVAESEAARNANKLIAATVYYYGLLASIDIARSQGHSYDTYVGSTFAAGQFQFDIRNAYINERLATLQPPETPTANRYLEELVPIVPHPNYPWDDLRRYMLVHGLANGTLTAGQPTETSAKLNRVCEMCEPYRGNKITTRSHNTQIVIRNQKLVRFCNNLGLPAASIMQHAESNNGSIADFPDIPDLIKALFRTVYEYDPLFLIDMTADREPYIDMAQSHNLYLSKASTELLTKCTMHAMYKMLVTFSYYVRVRAAPTLRVMDVNSGLVGMTDSNIAEGCTSCSS